jgi:O-antigen/teichoic acid export membrane protein
MNRVLQQFNRLWGTWRQDVLLKKVIRNSSYLLSSSTIGMVLTSLMGFLVALLLGPAESGKLGLIVMLVSSINRLLSFRMGEVVIKFAGQNLTLGRNFEAAAVIKVAAIAEAGVSIIAFFLLWLISSLAAEYIIKDTTSTWLLIFFGVSLLGNMMNETSLAVLQLGNHYRTQAALTLAQNVLMIVWVGVVFLVRGGLESILTAYLVGKLVYGIGSTLMALYWMKGLLGQGWMKAPLQQTQGWRNMARFGLSTNISGTINLLIRDTELLWVGFFLTTMEVGYYKLAFNLMNLMMMPITPLIATTFPEITAAVTNKNWDQLRSLLKKTTIISGFWTVACGLGYLLFGRWILTIFRHGDFLPSYPVVWILLIGYGVANIFFWNRPLLLAYGKTNFLLRNTSLTGLAKIILMFILVRPFGIAAQAALTSGYFIITIGRTVQEGIKSIRNSEAKSEEVKG